MWHASCSAHHSRCNRTVHSHHTADNSQTGRVGAGRSVVPEHSGHAGERRGDLTPERSELCLQAQRTVAWGAEGWRLASWRLAGQVRGCKRSAACVLLGATHARPLKGPMAAIPSLERPVPRAKARRFTTATERSERLRACARSWPSSRAQQARARPNERLRADTRAEAHAPLYTRAYAHGRAGARRCILVPVSRRSRRSAARQ